jgi:hypothetical protein
MLGTDCSGFLCPNEAVFELRDVLEDAGGKTARFVQIGRLKRGKAHLEGGVIA